jgi:hypothetical protein
MRILGFSCVKNEAGRYLADSLRWNGEILDSMFVYDDCSDDDTVNVALNAGADVSVRPDTVSSFMEHEAKFRYAAWLEFERVVEPELGDWVLSFDADEFLVTDTVDRRSVVESEIKKAQSFGNLAVMLHFPEVFFFDGVQIGVRKDGYWDTIYGPRLFAYKPDGVWPDVAMGCGAQPSYVAKGSSYSSSSISMLHFGYASESDRAMKWERYTSVYDHGHSNTHIQSIKASPRLELWDGMSPQFLG